MWTLNRYVVRGFLLAFFMAIAILTFGMTGANLVKMLDYLSQGVSCWTFCKFIFYMMPIVLTFTVPWAVMVAVMLVFGRLSADSEITAMRACGVSIMQIVSPILIITFILTLFCLYLQTEIGPPYMGKSRQLLKNAAIDNPLALFEPGAPVEFGNTLIYIDDKENDSSIVGIQMLMLDRNGGIDKDITAARGTLALDEEKQQLTVSLDDCLVMSGDGMDLDDEDEEKKEVPLRFFAKNLQFKFKYGEQTNAENIGKRAKYMRLRELIGRIRLTRENGHDTTELEVELNQRIAFALSPIAFLLFGLPLAIRTNRRETSVGLFLSVILAGVFFLSVIMCESLSSHPELYPQYLLWLPNIIFQIGGAIMTYRISRQ